MQQLQRLKLFSCKISNILLPPSIEDLEISSCMFSHPSQDLVQQSENTFPALPNLKALNMVGSVKTEGEGETYPQFIRQAASKTEPGTLSSLSLGESSSWPSAFISLMAYPWFRGLMSLSVERGVSIKDEHSRVLLDHCPDLEEFMISNARITGVFLADLIKAPNSRIYQIIVENCDKVSRDIVPWAKERGVGIDYIAPALESGGRRLREG